MGLYSPTAGAIMVGDVPLSELDLQVPACCTAVCYVAAASHVECNTSANALDLSLI
jgi:hypothetical protein